LRKKVNFQCLNNLFRNNQVQFKENFKNLTSGLGCFLGAVTVIAGALGVNYGAEEAIDHLRDTAQYAVLVRSQVLVLVRALFVSLLLGTVMMLLLSAILFRSTQTAKLTTRLRRDSRRLVNSMRLIQWFLLLHRKLLFLLTFQVLLGRSLHLRFQARPGHLTLGVPVTLVLNLLRLLAINFVKFNVELGGVLPDSLLAKSLVSILGPNLLAEAKIGALSHIFFSSY
jgi:hypothetical protein